MKVIGITGPTGAGKTTVLKAWGALGAEIIDADAVYHGLLEGSGEMKNALAAAFGQQILDRAGRVDRKALAAAAYPHRLGELEELTHPAILAAIAGRVEQARTQGRSAAVIDAIALIESGLARQCDAVVAVLAPKEVRIRRVMARDGIDESYARQRVAGQKEDGFYRDNSDYVLENGDSPESFVRQAEELFGRLLAR